MGVRKVAGLIHHVGNKYAPLLLAIGICLCQRDALGLCASTSYRRMCFRDCVGIWASRQDAGTEAHPAKATAAATTMHNFSSPARFTMSLGVRVLTKSYRLIARSRAGSRLARNSMRQRWRSRGPMALGARMSWIGRCWDQLVDGRAHRGRPGGA